MPPSNHAPVVSGAVTGSATEDGPSSTLDALVNATDIDAGTVLTVVNIPPVLPAGVTYDAASHSFTFDPSDEAYQSLAQGQTRTVTVRYDVSDGKAARAASVQWTVIGMNDTPVVSGPVKGGATEDGAISRLNALANAADADKGTTLAVVGIPATLPAGVTFDPTTNRFALDPSHAAYQSLAAGQTTTVAVSYGISDGLVTTAASVEWTVTGMNDAPVVSGPVKGDVAEDGAGSTLDALANATDIDAGTVLTVVNIPAVLPAGVTYDAASHSFTLDPSNQAYQSLAQGQTRTVTVKFDVTDGRTTKAATAQWMVTGIDDAPVVSGPVKGTALEDGAISRLNALANAADADKGTTLSVVDVPAGLPAGVTYDPDKQQFRLDPKHPVYQALAPGQTTTVTVEYGVTDGQSTTAAAVEWAVTGVNHAPKVSGRVSATVTEDGAASTLHGLANATDIDPGSTLSIVDVPAELPAGVTYDAAAQAFRLDPADPAFQVLARKETTRIDVTYGVTDGIDTVAASVRWTITGVNDAPLASADTNGSDAVVEAGMLSGGTAFEGDPSASGNVLLNDIDPDRGDTRSVIGVAAGLQPGLQQTGVGSIIDGRWGTLVLAADGSWTYTLDNGAADTNALVQGQMADDVFTYTMRDLAGATSTAVVTITIQGANDLPVIAGVSSGHVTEDVAALSAGLMEPIVIGPLPGPAPGGDGLVVDDVNGDGIADIIVGAFASDGISVYLGNGDGTCEAPAAYSNNGSSYLYLDVGDLDGDGLPDIAVPNGNALAILLNSGDGTFGGATPVPGLYAGVAIGDLDADGNNDLALTSETFGLKVVLGNGDGSFGAPVSYATAAAPLAVAIEDVNGDGALDLVVGANRANAISVLLGDRSGTFGAPANYQAFASGLPGKPFGLALGDFNGDGRPDIVTSNQEGGSNELAVLLNLGSGTFGLPIHIPVASPNRGLDVADVNGDGKLDIVASSHSAGVQVILGNGDGTFAPGQAFPELGHGYDLEVADLNGDGAPDVVAGTQAGLVAILGAATLTATGSLTIHDADGGQSSFREQANVPGTNGYGTFSVAADGTWTYTARNDQPRIQELRGGETATDFFTVVSADGTASQLVTVTLHGSNDPPVIAGDATGEIIEDGPTSAGRLVASGKLVIADLDQGQSSFAAQTAVTGANGFGEFTLAENGEWAYTAVNSQPAIQQLAAGQLLEDSFTAVSSDGAASQVVTVTIEGTTDTAFYAFDESAGTLVGDSEGFHPGTIVNFNAAMRVPGVVGNALSFNGVNQYVSVPDSPDWNLGTGDFSIQLYASFRATPTGTAAHPSDVLVGQDEGPGITRKWFIEAYQGHLGFAINGPGLGPQFFAQTPFDPVLDRWYLIQLERVGSTYRFYVDGQAGPASVNTSILPDVNAPLMIGNSEGLFFNGRIDDVSIARHALPGIGQDAFGTWNP